MIGLPAAEILTDSAGAFQQASNDLRFTAYLSSMGVVVCIALTSAAIGNIGSQGTLLFFKQQ